MNVIFELSVSSLRNPVKENNNLRLIGRNVTNNLWNNLKIWYYITIFIRFPKDLHWLSLLLLMQSSLFIYPSNSMFYLTFNIFEVLSLSNKHTYTHLQCTLAYRYRKLNKVFIHKYLGQIVAELSEILHKIYVQINEC